MQNDANIENEGGYQPLDTEDWEIAFEPYEGNPGPALSLGFNLVVLKSYLIIAPPRIQDVVDGLDRAMAVLFQHSQFHEVAYGLFHRLIEGQLTREEEELLKSLV